MVVSPSQQDGLLDKAAPVDKLLAVDEAISPPPKWKKKKYLTKGEQFKDLLSTFSHPNSFLAPQLDNQYLGNLCSA